MAQFLVTCWNQNLILQNTIIVMIQNVDIEGISPEVNADLIDLIVHLPSYMFSHVSFVQMGGLQDFFHCTFPSVKNCVYS